VNFFSSIIPMEITAFLMASVANLQAGSKPTVDH
jgi:hypothetical protein